MIRGVVLNLIREELLEVDPFFDRAGRKLHELFKGNKAGRLVLCRRDASLAFLHKDAGLTFLRGDADLALLNVASVR